MKKQQVFVKSGKLLLSLGMVFTMLTPANVFANEPVTPSDGEKVETPTEGEIATPQQEKDSMDSGIMPLAFDTTAPVIEDVRLPKNGQTVNAGDTVELFVQAYDDSKEIATIETSVTYKDKNNHSKSVWYNIFTKTDKENEYKIVIEALDGYDIATIDYVKVVDHSQNDTSIYSNMDTFSLSFDITKSFEITDDYEIDNIEFEQNKETLKSGDNLTFKVTLKGEDADDIARIDLRFSNIDENGKASYFYASLYKDTSGAYVGDCLINNSVLSGEYKLDQVDLSRKSNGDVVYIEYPDKDAYTFSITGEVDTEKPVITSIEMDKKGEVVKPGDVIHFKIKAEDNVALNPYANLYVYPAKSIDSGSVYVALQYDENEKAYVGSFEITSSTYPTEWYIDGINIYDTFNNYASLTDYDPDFYNSYPYYFLVNNDETFVTVSSELNIQFNALNEESHFYDTVGTYSNKKVPRRSTYKELNISYPEVKDVKGMKFIGWRTYDGKMFDENSMVPLHYESLTLYAVYDKVCTNLNYTYPGADGRIHYENKEVLIDTGTTYRQLLEQAKDYVPKDIDSTYVFNGWSTSDMIDLDDEIQSGYGFSLTANFNDKVFVQKVYSYYDTKGLHHSDSEIVFVDAGSDRSVINKTMTNKEAPVLFKGLRFKNWYFYSRDGEIKSGDGFYATAEYENCMIRFGIDEGFRPKDNKQMRGAAGGVDDSQLDSLYAMVVEYGDTFTVPEIPGYKNITWLAPKPEGTNLVANGDRDFYGYGDKDGSDSSNNKPDDNKPDDNNNNNVPDDSDNNNNGNNDNSNNDNGNNGGNIDQETNNGIELPDTVIANTIHSIANAPAGEKIKVDMGNATVVPVDVLAAAKGKDVDVVLNMGGYSWTINGKDILASNLKDINLEVKMDTQAVPSKLIQTLAGDNPIKQLSLTHNGDFGFKASLSLNIGSEYNGKYGNLYYYDSDGKLKFMNAGKIDADGNVSLEFSHASDYVIIINDKIMEEPIKDTATGTAQDPLSAMMVFCLLGCGYYVLSKKANSVSNAK